jgi:hypothetical protein
MKRLDKRHIIITDSELDGLVAPLRAMIEGGSDPGLQPNELRALAFGGRVLNYAPVKRPRGT